MLFKYPDDDGVDPDPNTWRIGIGATTYYPGAEPLTLEDPLTTTEAIVDALNSLYEGENYHSMVGTSEKFVSVLRGRGVTEDTITAILFDIANVHHGFI